MADINADAGNLLVNTSGDLAACSDSCLYPTMYVTVTNNSSNVGWCGETWTPLQSGEQREICPASYYSGGCDENPGYYTSGGINYTSIIRRCGAVWIFGIRWNLTFGVNYTTWIIKKEGVLQNSYYSGTAELDGVWGSSYKKTYKNMPDYTYGALGKMAGVPMRTLAIDTSNFTEGSYTTGGVTYSWSKGAGW